MTKPAIELDHVSKTFKSFMVQSMGRVAFDRVRGKGVPREKVHALNDVSFQIAPGASVALMGLNGSGKTTALSLIARVATPSAGRVTIRGRVGALLAVGTGLHGDLTGRENVEVYGKILGYTSAELAKRFDDIVEFAEIGDALDRPLKFYSSGMALRLGFSIAAHVHPEIMLVDEAISVGDVLFQQRCLDRMIQLVHEGSALILVSHQPNLVARTCREGYLLRAGELVSHGPVEDIIGEYYEESGRLGGKAANQSIEIVEWDLSDVDFAKRRMRIQATVRSEVPVDAPLFAVTIADLDHGPLLTTSMVPSDHGSGPFKGTYTVSCEFRELPLREAVYRITLHATTPSRAHLVLSPHVLGHVKWGEPSPGADDVDRPHTGAVVVPTSWAIEQAKKRRAR